MGWETGSDTEAIERLFQRMKIDTDHQRPTQEDSARAALFLLEKLERIEQKLESLWWQVNDLKP